MTDGTAFGPDVYGMLWRTQSVRLTEEKPYTMSAWVKSEGPGKVELVGGQDWLYRVHAIGGGGPWRRVWGTFTPRVKDRDFILRINTECPVRGVWIDDVKLEEGTARPRSIRPAMAARAVVEADEQEIVRATAPSAWLSV